MFSLIISLTLVNANPKVSQVDFYSLVPNVVVKPRHIVVKPVQPSRGWYNNVSLTTNGRIYTGMTMYGYINANNHFIFNKSEQTDQVKNLINPPLYYRTNQGTIYCVGGT